RVFDRNPRLIVVAVSHPLLELSAGELPFVHQAMTRVAVVIAALAFAAQPRDEVVLRQRIAVFAHSAISVPSSAISQPAARTAAASSESSRSMGLVLLT